MDSLLRKWNQITGTNRKRCDMTKQVGSQIVLAESIELQNKWLVYTSCFDCYRSTWPHWHHLSNGYENIKEQANKPGKIQLLHNYEDHWLSLVFSICYAYIWSTSCTHYKSISWYNSLLTCSQQGFISQLVEHCTGIARGQWFESYWSPRIFFWAWFWNCLSYFTTAKIALTSILFPQCIHMIYTMSTSIVVK